MAVTQNTLAFPYSSFLRLFSVTSATSVLRKTGAKPATKPLGTGFAFNFRLSIEDSDPIGTVDRRIDFSPFNFELSIFNGSSLSPFPATLTDHSQLIENAVTLSPAFVALTSHVKANPFVCHSCRKTPGGGVPLRARIFLSYPKASHLTAPPPEIFSWVRCTENMDQSSTKPCVSLPGPDVPRGAL
jgi:hypothetical protein